MNNQSQTTTTTTTTTTMSENFTDFPTAATEAPMMSGFDDDWAANNSTMASGTAKDSSSSTSDDNTVTSMVGCALFLFFVMYYGCCQRRRPVSTDTGDRIRRIARERWRREQLEQERNTQKPEKRQELLRLCLRNKKVISKDAEGNLQLGPLHKASVPAPVVCSPCTPAAGVAATVASVPTTPPTAPTTPTTPTTTPDYYGTIDDDDEEEHACVICLEPFEVDDIVSWSRYSKTCHHVFHTDCIEPWLLERRQDDCPSCRSKLVQFNYDDPDSPVKENLEKLLLSSSTEDDSNAEHDVQEFHLEDDDEGEEEGDSIFVIVHGMISRAARQATSSYALVGTKDSMEEDDYDSEREEVEGEEDFSDIEEGGKKPSAVDLANPAPMRRVMSYEAIAHDSPQHNRKRRSLRGSIRDMFFPRKLFSEEEELEAKERAMQQQRYDQQEEHRPVPLRRVVSEGLSPNAPSLPDVSDRTAAAVSNMIPSSPSQTLQRRASTSSFLQMRRSESYQQQQQYDHSEASSYMSDEEDDLEWRFGAISPSPLSPASSRLAGTGEQQRPTISIPDGACPLPSANNDDDGDEDEV